MIQQKGSYLDLLQSLKEKRRTFTVKKTSGTCIVEEADGTETMFYTDELFSGSDFGFINSLKSRIRKSEAFKNLVKAIDATENSAVTQRQSSMTRQAKNDSKHILAHFGLSPQAVQYYDFGKSLYNMKLETGCCYDYTDAIECDITKAYYYTAKIMGIIDEEFFKKCLNLPKHKRLRMMGSIATNRIVYEYKDGKLETCFVKNDKYMRAVWLSICKYVDQCMLDIKNIIDKKDFLFYWVDGIYFNTSDKRKTVGMIDCIMREYGFDYKMTELKKISFENHEGELKIKVAKPKLSDSTEFYLPKKKVKAYYLGNPIEGMETEEGMIYI